MEIKKEHGIVYHAEPMVYLVRLEVFHDSGEKSKAVVVATREYIADTYAGQETVSDVHTQAWLTDAVERLKGFPEEAFLIDQPYRELYGSDPRGVAYFRTVIA